MSWDSVARIAAVVLSVLVIIVVLLQPGHQAGLSATIAGGNEQGGTSHHLSPLERLLQRATWVIGGLFFADALAIAWLTVH
ncbi:MAG: preprotein translocase subunit SecG [Firmicutes bacterium]|nr:preprotein translocase subunit SecG [Bacillota bacterium]